MWLLVIWIPVLLSLFYIQVRTKLNYWSNLQVPHLPPDFLIGNLRGFQTKYKVSTLVKHIYDRTKGIAPIAGLYIFTAPVAIVSNLDFLKHVFVKDFEYFSDRGLYYNERDDPLSANLVTLPHDQWKPLRAKMSSTFQPVRLKMMHPMFESVAKDLGEYLKKAMQDNAGEVDFSETFNQYTTALILQTVYGIESKCFGQPESPFCRIGPSIMNKTRLELLKDLVLIVFPNLSRMLRLKFNRDELREFFMGLCRDTIQLREANKIQRNDFLSLLMQLRKSGTLDSVAVTGSNNLELLTDDQVAAQAFIFFFGGFETSAKTLGYVLYELALNPEVQERVRREVQAVYKEHGDIFSYDALQDMSYLNQVINETLRKYPVIDTAFRQVTKDYQIPNTSIVIRKGQKLIIPIFAIHRDSEIYPDPDTFDPERFTKEAMAARHPYAWIPFASGPRHCIGARYAGYTIRMAVASILNEFRVSPCQRTEMKMAFKLNRQILEPLKNIWLKVDLLDDL